MRLSAHGVVLVRSGRPVLRGVDAAVGPGELVGLIGANGAGKSTLLRLLAGLLRLDAGEVAFDGTPLRAIRPTRLALARAYLPQTAEAHWSLTAGQAVALARLPHRGAKGQAADAAAVTHAMQSAGTLALRDRRLDQLSGGERMRVLLARALAVEAPVLLADEPIAGLDPLQQIRVMEVLRRLAESGTAVIAVLHDLTLAARFCHRLTLLHDGVVLADAAPDAVLTDANLAAAYGISVRRHDGYVVPWDALR
ncbi:MAG: ABC transporter ATP-binding protein [Acetobacteraceae bacterium]